MQRHGLRDSAAQCLAHKHVISVQLQEKEFMQSGQGRPADEAWFYTKEKQDSVPRDEAWHDGQAKHASKNTPRKDKIFDVAGDGPARMGQNPSRSATPDQIPEASKEEWHDSQARHASKNTPRKDKTFDVAGDGPAVQAQPEPKMETHAPQSVAVRIGTIP